MRVAPLDLLRFLAAAAVMIYHFTYHYAGTLSSLEAVTRHGYLGVDVFFLISGFVVLWSTRGRTATEFVRARLLRLYPEFWIAVVASALVFTVVTSGIKPEFAAADVVANLTMIPQYLGAPYVDGVYWTLGVELKFYALLWVMLLAHQSQRIEGWLYGWLAVAAVATFVNVGGVVRSLTIYPYGPLFASGGLFYLVFDSGWTRPRVLAITSGFILAAIHSVRGLNGFIDASHITPAAEIATVGVIAGAFVAFAMLRRVEIPSRLASHCLVLGGLTYPLYLLHNTGKEIFLLSGVLEREWAAVSAAIAFSIVISYTVMRLGTGPVRSVLRSGIDLVLVKARALRR